MSARLCQCGCGVDLEGRDVRAKYASNSCRTRAYERRLAAGEKQPAPAAAPPPEPLPEGQVTRAEAERRKAQAQAELSSLRAERERGEWIRAGEVEDELSRRNVAVRELVLAVDTDALVQLHPSMKLDEIRDWYAERHRLALEAAASREEAEDDA